MMGDKHWTGQYLEKMRPMLSRQQSIVLNGFDWCPWTPPATKSGFFELRNYRLKAGAVPAWEALFKKGLPARIPFSRPVGVFFTEHGMLNSVVHLWGYDSHAHRAQVRKDALTDPLWRETVVETVKLMETQESTIMIPTAWSPLK